MRLLFRLIFSLGLLVAVGFVCYQYLVQTDSELGRQLESIFGELGGQKVTPEERQAAESRSKTELQVPEINSNENAASPERKVLKLYRWKDDNGRTQVTDQPPEDKEFKVITYQDPKNIALTPQTSVNTPNFNYQVPHASQTGQSTAPIATKPTPLPVQCQVKMRDVKRLERKLDKADDVVESIWLQDYCSALSELIQDSCVVPKSEVKYNRYCPVRFKR
ncbi:DUF4124 domain-containing protein [Aliikangiella marina]|nr:DUF4124 domain-containing protein [Aliikangiella marina]